MNQDEITKDIKHANGMIENLGLQIAWWECRSLGLQEKQDQLAEAEEPGLRHGDIRLWFKSANQDVSIIDLSEPEPHAIWMEYDLRNKPEKKHILSRSRSIGNITEVFADLKALAKPLKGFIEGGVRYSINTGHGVHAGMIQIGIDFWTIQNVKSHILNLRRLVHTAEQEAAK